VRARLFLLLTCPTLLVGAGPAKIIDLVFVNQEIDTLETRFFELNDTVDLFVVAEGDRTHRGARKSLFFSQACRTLDTLTIANPLSLFSRLEGSAPFCFF